MNILLYTHIEKVAGLRVYIRFTLSMIPYIVSTLLENTSSLNQCTQGKSDPLTVLVVIFPGCVQELRQ